MAELFQLAGLPEVLNRLQELGVRMLPFAGIALQQEADAILEASQPLVPV